MNSRALFLILRLLRAGGPPLALREALAEIIADDVFSRLYVTEAGREYIRREVEYLMDYLAGSDRVTNRFVATRISALRANLLSMGLACPRAEIPISALGDDGDRDADPDRILHSRLGEAEPRPLRDSVERKGKTVAREMRLMRLKRWEIGCLRGEKRPKPAQGSLFGARH